MVKRGNWSWQRDEIVLWSMKCGHCSYILCLQETLKIWTCFRWYYFNTAVGESFCTKLFDNNIRYFDPWWRSVSGRCTSISIWINNNMNFLHNSSSVLFISMKKPIPPHCTTHLYGRNVKYISVTEAFMASNYTHWLAPQPSAFINLIVAPALIVLCIFSVSYQCAHLNAASVRFFSPWCKQFISIMRIFIGSDTQLMFIAHLKWRVNWVFRLAALTEQNIMSVCMYWVCVRTCVCVCVCVSVCVCVTALHCPSTVQQSHLHTHKSFTSDIPRLKLTNSHTHTHTHTHLWVL